MLTISEVYNFAQEMKLFLSKILFYATNYFSSPYPQWIFLLAPRIWEPRDQPQPVSFRSERGGVAVSGDKALGTRLEVGPVQDFHHVNTNY